MFTLTIDAFYMVMYLDSFTVKHTRLQILQNSMKLLQQLLACLLRGGGSDHQIHNIAQWSCINASQPQVLRDLYSLGGTIAGHSLSLEFSSKHSP